LHGLKHRGVSGESGGQTRRIRHRSLQGGCHGSLHSRLLLQQGLLLHYGERGVRRRRERRLRGRGRRGRR
jgi:hypothetical protein